MDALHRGRLQLLESAWDMHADGPAWLLGLAHALHELQPGGVAPAAVSYQSDGDALRVGAIAGPLPDPMLAMMARSFESANPELVRWVEGHLAAGVAALRYPHARAEHEHAALARTLEETESADSFTLLVQDAPGFSLALVNSFPCRGALSDATQRVWHAVGQHLRDAARFRRLAWLQPAREADAIVADDGSVRALAPGLQAFADELAMRARQAAGARQAEEEERWVDASTLYEQVADGQWLFVPLPGPDTTSTYAAFRTPEPSLRRLTPREATVMERCVGDTPLKVVADELGLSEAVISRCLRGALRKLGLRHRTELITLLRGRDEGVGPRLLDWNGTQVAYWMQDVLPDVLRDRLTPAEVRVCVLVSQGLSERDIAQRLGIARSTVCNHTTAIYRKAGVGSRAQLAHWMGQAQRTPAIVRRET